MTNWPVHARFSGPIVMIGFGSIGRGTLPLILRHFDCDLDKMAVVDPDSTHRHLVEREGIDFHKVALTPDNFRDVLTPLLKSADGPGFLVNLSVDVSSIDLIAYCKEVGALYIDTVIEPWLGHYDNATLTVAERSNYMLRENLLKLRREQPGGPTAVSCSGANPGMVSWFVKQALLNLARDLGITSAPPEDRAGWAALMRETGVKGVHIAETDTQRSADPKPRGTFVNTWSVEGFISEGKQPAELGWGTHEKSMPEDGRRHETGCGAAIYLLRPGAGTRVRTWTPTSQGQHAFLVTHNESISIADYYTVREGEEVVYRPTCHYAYHPCDDAVMSLHEMAGHEWKAQRVLKVLEEDEIVDGIDELGVLLYGHAKNAYWFGSQLSVEETRQIAPHQNATGLQVTSAVLAGMVWAMENPEEGIVEADEMDFARCLDVQLPYLGPVNGFYSDWTPLKDRGVLFPEEVDASDPWQFRNVIVR